MLKVLIFSALLLTVEALAKQTPPNLPSVDSSTSSTPTSSSCRSWISFSFDDSNTLTNGNFRTQMSFIKNVIGSMSYPNRLRAEGAFTGEFTWNSNLNIPQMQSAIDAAQQTSIQYSLLQMFAGLATSVDLLNYPYDPIAALIFISDTSDNALRNAERYLGLLSNVKITFVMLGNNVDTYKLTKFSSNFIYWSDLSQPKPDNWDYYANNAFGCDSSFSPTYPSYSNTPMSSTAWGNPSTTSWYRSSSTPGWYYGSTTNWYYPSTTNWYSGNTATTSAPYYPCYSWISFGVDTSTNLEQGFNNQINFIASAIGKLNHPERLQVIRNNGNSVVEWNSYYQSIPQIQLDVVQLGQTDGKYSLRNQFAKLAAELQNFNRPVGAIIFISDTSDGALSGADIFASYLKDITLTFVLMGSHTDQSKLTKYSYNFISWKDMTQSQPDNWDSSYYAAYGCAPWALGKKPH